MPLILLIRHGENDLTKKRILAGRMPGIHLNERGREQARRLAESLKKLPLKAIYSSPLERAVETATSISEALGLKLQLDDSLMETQVGRWQGRSLRTLRLSKTWRIVQAAPSRAQFPAGESFYECQTRVVAALDAICRKHKPKDMLAVVFHADPIKLAVAHYIGLPLDHFQRLGCDTGSVTLLAIHDSGANLLWLNQTPPFDFHLTKKKK
jgi:probable phosphomutase (TIGR03848 family)